MIDKNGKLFGKINIIDLVIILVLVIAIAVGGMFFIRNRKTEAQTQTLIIKFYTEEVSDFVIEKVKVGDALYDADKSVDMGVITNIEINDSVTYGSISEGEYETVAKEGYSSAVITGEVVAQKNALGALIGGQQYGVGHSMVLRAGDAKIYLRVHDIGVKSEIEATETEEASKQKNVNLTLEAYEVADYIASSIKEGDLVYDHSSGIVLGTVSSIEVSPAKVYVETSDGKITTSAKEGYSSIKITAAATAEVNENGTIIIDNKKYSLGKEFNSQIGNALVEDSVVTNIE